MTGAPAGSALIIDLPSELRSIEADTLDDMRHLAYGFKRPRRDVVSVAFSKLDSLRAARRHRRHVSGCRRATSTGSSRVMTPVGKTERRVVPRCGEPRRELSGQGGARCVARRRRSRCINGQFAFDMYAGPQSWQELHAFGNDLENVNPYAGFLHAVVQPFATIVMRVLLWMKATFHLNYGWVLVLFGVAIRLLLWPLNQKAMRTSIQMQRLQPELTEVQKQVQERSGQAARRADEAVPGRTA